METYLAVSSVILLVDLAKEMMTLDLFGGFCCASGARADLFAAQRAAVR